MRNRNSFVLVCVFVSGLLMFGCFAPGTGGAAGASNLSAPSATPQAGQARQREGAEAELDARLKAICARAGGEFGVAVTHVETGRGVAVEGEKALPLYSVFKLPLAVAVLQDVEAGKLRLEQKARVETSEVVPGWRGNTDLWAKAPVELTVAELIELSIVRSDNTSSDKLFQLVGGPPVVAERMRTLGLRNLDIRTTVGEYVKKRENPNTGTAQDLAQLLARLRKGEVLQPAQLSVLLGYMERAVTGLKRLRGDLPAGTRVADKTGTGTTTINDVGLITLPEGKGHLAMAVLLNNSKLPAEAQEKLIAEMARAAYDAHAPAAANNAPATR